MKMLQDILANIDFTVLQGELDVAIHAICNDSRECKDQSLFAAISGTSDSGAKYINSAIANGAIVVLVDEVPRDLEEDILYIQVDLVASALGIICRNYYENPSSQLKLIGVTGTNGKSTIASLLYQLYTHLGYKCGLISTIDYRIGIEVFPATHTTPDAIHFNELMHLMVGQDIEYVFAEISSHAMEQYRVTGLVFHMGLFTNLTHDHLDYHKTFLNYINAKKKFFDDLGKNAFAIINIDDKNGLVMTQNTDAKVVTYSKKRNADYRVKLIENSLTGLILELNGSEVHTFLSGEFNAYNIAAVYAMAMSDGQIEKEVLKSISWLKPVEGRMDIIWSEVSNIKGVIDYAHTPDALQNTLHSVAQTLVQQEKLLCVVGCGGDRDRLKRPAMAKIAVELSDKVVLTSDNPRSENPMDIILEMEQGIDPDDTTNVYSIPDRKQAIKLAIQLAENGDVIVIAGKGHEKTQEIQGVKYPFDDKVIFTELLNQITSKNQI